MSLKKAIRDKIPYNWELVLKRHKKLGEFVDNVYLSLPEHMKGKDGFRDGVIHVTRMFRYKCLYDCMLLEGVCNEKGLDLTTEKVKWRDLSDKAIIADFNSL